MDFINCDGPVMHRFLMDAQPRMTQFTGSSRIGEFLAKELNGRIKLEDAGWDWKVLGPDVHDLDYVAWVCDQDAYAYSGQKCSAQSALFVHKNWVAQGLLSKIEALAKRRRLEDLTMGPILTVPNDRYGKCIPHFASPNLLNPL
ncbi:aldehyde dehydrogenase family protein [archaeon]|nr:MAG: aldehyde dehydrogenase family protein [archaeon]